MNILQVNKADTRCGAMRTAWGLHHAHLEKGYQARIAVGIKSTNTQDVIQLDNEPRTLAGRLVRRLRQTLLRQLGLDDFGFPGIRRLLTSLPEMPDIFHGHNLHDQYFDLRILPALSRRMTVVLTLHDAWLLSGHCAHSFDCKRWQTGCGNCPNLNIYQSIRRDATAVNWRRRQRIFKKCRLYVSTPSKWLMDKVHASMLAPAIVESRVIPNGVDLDVFHPAPYRKQAIRAELGLPANACVALFTAKAARTNPWKDFATLHQSLELIASRPTSPRLILLVLGDDGKDEQLGSVHIRYVPFESKPEAVARYYQAADMYVHPARADTFPYAILEAMACGLPVIASRVGGIPEQIVDGLVGLLISRDDPAGLAERILALIEQVSLRHRLGETAWHETQARFTLSRQAATYQEWFETIRSE